jgi:hypothetical protein
VPRGAISADGRLFRRKMHLAAGVPCVLHGVRGCLGRFRISDDGTIPDPVPGVRWLNIGSLATLSEVLYPLSEIGGAGRVSPQFEILFQ